MWRSSADQEVPHSLLPVLSHDTGRQVLLLPPLASKRKLVGEFLEYSIVFGALQIEVWKQYPNRQDSG